MGIIGTERTSPLGFMSFSGTASWVGAADTAHVDGYVKSYLTSAFIFPIGDNGSYRPIAISGATVSAPIWAAYYGVDPSLAITSSLKGGNEPVLPASAPFVTTTHSTELTQVSAMGYWDIQGSHPTNLTLTWIVSSDVATLTSNELTRLTIAGWNGSQWVKIASAVDATSILGGNSTLTTGSITTTGSLVPNTYQAYTLAALTPANTAPVITSNGGGVTAALSVSENQTAVTTVTATDAEGDTLSYSLSGGADQALFTINTSSGVLNFINAPSFATPQDSNVDNVYQVQVSASDGHGGTDTQLVSITVLPAQKVLEYTVRRDATGRYHVYMRPQVNPTSGQNLSLTGQVTLTVPTGTGASRFLVGNLINTVPNVTWEVTSRVDAPTEKTTTDYLSFTFNPYGVSDFNWQAGVELEVFNFINTNAAACVGSVAVMDTTDPFNQEPNSVGSVPANQFTNLGWGSVTDNNYAGWYGSPVDCASPNAAPVITSNGGGDTATLNHPAGTTTVTTVTATDADNDPLTFSISGGADAAKFTLNSSTGVLSFITAPTYGGPVGEIFMPAGDSDGNNIYEVTVQVSDGRGGTDTQALSITLTQVSVGLGVKALLQGPYNATEHLMVDTLRTLNLIPTAQPYGQSTYSYLGTETVSAARLAVTGQNAPVDWVLVQLRNPLNHQILVAQQAAIVERDGDVVHPTTGATTLSFTGISAGTYYVAVAHRNHLGVMSAAPIDLTPSPLVDFTQTTTATYDTHARFEMGSRALLWAGDINHNHNIIGNGPDNDTNELLGKVLMASGNRGLNSNYALQGYYDSDLDLNGVTLFAGPNNDTNILVGNVLLHPLNSTFSGNYVIQGRLPKLSTTPNPQ